MLNLSINSVPLVGALPPVEFPFNFLHAELVRHFKQREAESAKKKSEWANVLKDKDFVDALNQNDQSLNKMIFSQVYLIEIFLINNF